MGAVEACREKKIAQIGNVGDWVATTPDVFIGSAIADSGLAVLSAAEDLLAGTFKPGVIRKIGLKVPAAIRLSVSDRVPADIRAKLDQAARDIADEKLKVSTEWSGPEFANP